MLGVAISAVAGVLLWFGLGRPRLDVTARPTPQSQPSAGPSATRSALTSAERLEAIKIVLAVVGGTGAVVALTVAYRKQRDGELAEYREDERVYTERFTAAANQLSVDSAQARVSGVYSLTELADDWPDGRQVCIEVLCAYLRLPYVPDPVKPGDPLQEREVRRTLVRVIRDHLRPGWTAVSWSGYNFSFEGAIFERGDLSNIKLDDKTRMTFHRAVFGGDYFLFNDADLNGARVWFTKATFSSPRVSFESVNFGSGQANFDGAMFTAGEVTFHGATASPGIVTFDQAQKTGATVD